MTELPFEELAHFLSGLGFSHRTIPGSHHLFENGTANATIALRLYESQDAVEPSGLAYVRHTLDQWGIMDRDEFDRRIRERALAG